MKTVPAHGFTRREVFDVIIIGGGLSGLSAALELAERGAKVALIERLPRLGGRCYSYLDQKTGDTVDNGQHVLIGAYHHTMRYLRRIGTHRWLKAVPGLSLPLHHPERGFASFQISSLPQPLHLTAGMLKFKLLSFRDKQRILKSGIQLKRWNTETETRLSGLTVEQWLNESSQSRDAKEAFWYPVAVSVMNETPQAASALLFARSLRAALFGSKSDSTILIPSIGQTGLYADGAVRCLRKRQTVVRTGSAVSQILIEHSNAIGVVLNDGEIMKSRSVICSVPHYAIRRMLPSPLRTAPPFGILDQIRSTPIVSIHLWFDRTVMEQEYTGLIGRRLQWVFNRRKLMNEPSGHGGYLSAVISAAHAEADLTSLALKELALTDLRSAFPEAVSARLVHSVVIKEKRATFSATPENDAIRPGTETPVRNLYLAGDWTQTGLPATIEGAVLSGMLASECIR